MLKGLFKPKWQHKKPAVRLQALINLEGSSDALIKVATSDPDLDVRLSAIQHLQHIPTLKHLAKSTSEKIPEKVKKRVIELTLTQPKLAELETVYYLVDEQQIHQTVVCDNHQCAAIRLHALKFIDDQALLFKLADTDESRQIQFLSATKLTDFKQLQKLKRLAKTNKKFRQLLKQKNAEYQQQQDFLRQTEVICQSLEALISRKPITPNQQEFSTLKQQWQQLKGDIPTAITQRFDSAIAAVEKAYADYKQQEQQRRPLRNKAEAILRGLDDLSHALLHTPNDFSQYEFNSELESLKTQWQILKEQLHDDEHHRYSLPYEDKVIAIEQTLSALTKDFRAIEKMQQLCTKVDKILVTKQMLQQKQISAIEKQWQKIPDVFTLDSSHYKTQYAETLHKIKQHLEQQIANRTHTEKEIADLLTKIEYGIENDQFKGAIKTYHRVNKQLKEAHYLDKGTMAQLRRRMHAVTPAIRQAESWRHWGTDKAREQLTEQATALVTITDIEPPERAKKIKALREEWKKLGKMDPSKHQRLWDNFDAACTKAYEPCQQYFKDEAVQRDKHLQHRHQLCQQLEALTQETDWNRINWRDIAKMINTLQGQWRKAGNVNRKSWNVVNKRFNQAMDDLEVHLSKERRRNWLQRQQLITQAEEIVTQLNTVNTDAIDSALETAIQAGKALQAQWQPTITAKRADEQKLWHQFRSAIDAVYERQRNKRDAVQNVLNANLQQKQGLLAEAEAIAQQNGEELLANQHMFTQIEKQFYPLHELPKGARQKVETAFNAIKNRITTQKVQAIRQHKLTQLLALGKESLEKNIKTSIHTADTEQALNLLLELEILLGLETPKDYQQERMQYQVGRLSEKMLTVAKEQHSDEEQALQKIQQWYSLATIDGDVGLMMQERFSPIQTWLENEIANV